LLGLPVMLERGARRGRLAEHAPVSRYATCSALHYSLWRTPLPSPMRRHIWLRTQPNVPIIEGMEVDQVDELRGLVQRLFRRFGTLGTDTTPCGQPLSVAHAHALMILLSRGDLTQQDLGAELCIDKSNVARLCAKMADEGHAEQTAGVQDRRSRVVSLTSEGKRLAREVNSASRQRFGALLSHLKASHRGQVIQALGYLVSAIEASAADHDEERTAK
jgi:DNA-binding MarR family transcriptional regulator